MPKMYIICKHGEVEMKIMGCLQRNPTDRSSENLNILRISQSTSPKFVVSSNTKNEWKGYSSDRVHMAMCVVIGH